MKMLCDDDTRESMALSLTEEIIRKRVNLQHDNLEDVKSLSLPGTYHEKVVTLGKSLKKFSRLKHLDLSRNAVSSLQGLEHLKLLEKLNLYYNQITGIEELKRLKYNQNLKEIDLRLNPVTRSEPDYRLYLIHMLPGLQRLDDRSVRDKERQAALLHFSSSDATEMTPHRDIYEPEQPQQIPRAEMIKGLGKGMAVLDDDDVAVLDLIARSEGELSKPRPITGSSNKQPDVEDYNLQDLKKIGKGQRIAKIEPSRQERPPSPDNDVNDIMASYRNKYPNIPKVNVKPPETDEYRENDKLDQHFGKYYAGLKYEDEVNAYTKYKTHGYFTPHPDAGKGNDPEKSIIEKDSYPDLPNVHVERKRRGNTEEEYMNSVNERKSQTSNSMVKVEEMKQRHVNHDPIKKLQFEETLDERGGSDVKHLQDNFRPRQKSSENPSKEENQLDSASMRLLLKLCDLVDRYWNGSKSLHKNQKFKSMAINLMTEYGSILGHLDDKLDENSGFQEQIDILKKENIRLREREDKLRTRLADTTAGENKLQATLDKAEHDIMNLKEELQRQMNENRKLQHRLQNTDNQHYSTAAGKSGTLASVDQTQLDEMERQNNALLREVETLRMKLKQHGQLQELTVMLQESHKSLVQTNDHLLRELNETKDRHKSEVKQLHWNYEELKKTMSFLPSQSVSHKDDEEEQDDRAVASATFYSEEEP